MTLNQIRYNELLETRRSNLQQEFLTAQRDFRSYTLGQQQLGETARHNQEMERHNVRVLGETNRHNLAQEQLGYQTLGETARHNLSTESISSAQNALRGQELIETKRSNLARESEATRSNRAREAEQARSNLRNEELKATSLDLERERLALQSWYNQQQIALGLRNLNYSYANLGEQRRSNMAREAETQRANRANEQLAGQQLGETISNNVRRDQLGWAQLQEQGVGHDIQWQLGLSGQGIQQQQADIARKNANTNARNSWVNVAKVFTDSAKYLIPLWG